MSGTEHPDHFLTHRRQPDELPALCPAHDDHGIVVVIGADHQPVEPYDAVRGDVRIQYEAPGLTKV
jgi:Zn-dependent alcohol dehydrogenase